MPQIQSQKKRVKTNNKRNLAVNAQKSALKTAVKTAVKKVEAAVEANDKEAAVAALNTANSKLDKAVAKGIQHRNYAVRQKSRLAKAVNSIAA